MHNPQGDTVWILFDQTPIFHSVRETIKCSANIDYIEVCYLEAECLRCVCVCVLCV